MSHLHACTECRFTHTPTVISVICGSSSAQFRWPFRVWRQQLVPCRVIWSPLVDAVTLRDGPGVGGGSPGWTGSWRRLSGVDRGLVAALRGGPGVGGGSVPSVLEPPRGPPSRAVPGRCGSLQYATGDLWRAHFVALLLTLSSVLWRKSPEMRLVEDGWCRDRRSRAAPAHAADTRGCGADRPSRRDKRDLRSAPGRHHRQRRRVPRRCRRAAAAGRSFVRRLAGPSVVCCRRKTATSSHFRRTKRRRVLRD